MTPGRRTGVKVPGVEEPNTADAACVVRLWVERGDPVLRGRVESTPYGSPATARGVDELASMLRGRLQLIEAILSREVGPG